MTQIFYVIMCWKSIMHLILLQCDKYPITLGLCTLQSIFRLSIFLLVVTRVLEWLLSGSVSAECCLIKVIKKSSGAASVISLSQHVASVGVQCLPWAVYSVQRQQRWPVQCTTFKLDHNWDRPSKAGKSANIDNSTREEEITGMEVLLWTMEDRWWSLSDREVTTNINGKCNFWQHYYLVFLWSLSMP